VDFALRSGLIVPAGPAGWGRPISERALGELAASLDRSALADTLAGLTRFADLGVESFHPEGGANRSHAATLVWRLEPSEPVAFEMTVRIEAPGHYGHSHVQTLQLTLTLVSRLTARLNVGRLGMLPRRRLDTAEWAALLDGMAATLTSPAVTGPVADLAGADPLTVRQPRVLQVVGGPAMPDLLPAQLSPIRDGGVSHGAHMADPALDLSEPAERAEQVDRWLIQMAADAGLRGMEQLISDMRRIATRLPAAGAAKSAGGRPPLPFSATGCRRFLIRVSSAQPRCRRPCRQRPVAVADRQGHPAHSRGPGFAARAGRAGSRARGSGPCPAARL
jgi:hypothetical protein